MKTLPHLFLNALWLSLLIGCGGIDSVPLPDNNPEDGATNSAGADDVSEPGSDSAEGAGDVDGSLDAETLDSFVVCTDSKLFLAPSGSIRDDQIFELESSDTASRVSGTVSSEGAVNASLETLPDGRVTNLVDGIEVSSWVLDSTWEPNERASEALRDLSALANDPFKRDGIFTWSQCGDASCLTVTDAGLSGDALIVGVFSQALERGVLKTIVSELIQIPLPPNSDGAAWKVVVGSSAQQPSVGEIQSLSPPSWE